MATASAPTTTTSINIPGEALVARAKPSPIPGEPVVLGNNLRGAMHAIERELNGVFCEREREIRGLCVALLAREHVLLLGPAGTAKSALAHAFCTALGGSTFFQWLLTRFSTPEEIFGPVSLNGLKNDKFLRVTTGKLPECEVAFLDEIYKANSAVLNSLLTVLNERKFDNDGGRKHVPVEIVVGASNELPEGPELAALHDRFMMRFWIQYTKTPDAFRAMITAPEPTITSRISLADLQAAQLAVAALPVADSAIDELFKLRGEVEKLGVVASDRRWKKAIRILRASAWMDGATEVTAESFPVLAAVLWETTDQIPKLAKAVAQYTSAELSDAQDIADAMMEMVGSIPSKEQATYAQQVTMTVQEMKKAHDKIVKLHAACRGVQSKQRIKAIADDIATRHAALRRSAAESLGL